MNWDALSAIAELLGAIAVVATLIYLSLQIRAQTESTRSANTIHVRAAANDINEQIASDPEMSRIYFAGLSGDLEDENDRNRFELIAIQIFRAVEGVFLEYERGMVDLPLWEATDELMGWIISQPGAEASWHRQKRFLAKPFQEYYAARIEKNST